MELRPPIEDRDGWWWLSHGGERPIIARWQSDGDIRWIFLSRAHDLSPHQAAALGYTLASRREVVFTPDEEETPPVADRARWTEDAVNAILAQLRDRLKQCCASCDRYRSHGVPGVQPHYRCTWTSPDAPWWVTFGRDVLARDGEDCRAWTAREEPLAPTPPPG